MRKKLHTVQRTLIGFELWFDRHFGWFFTNGMKHRRSEEDNKASSREPAVL